MDTGTNNAVHRSWVTSKERIRDKEDWNGWESRDKKLFRGSRRTSVARRSGVREA